MDFDVPAGPQTILPTSGMSIHTRIWGLTAMLTSSSVYLGGFICGPLIFAPLSESYGRKPILITGFTLFTLSTLATALAPNWPAFLVFRFLAGTFGAPPLSVGGGVIVSFLLMPE